MNTSQKFLLAFKKKNEIMRIERELRETLQSIEAPYKQGDILKVKQSIHHSSKIWGKPCRVDSVVAKVVEQRQLKESYLIAGFLIVATVYRKDGSIGTRRVSWFEPFEDEGGKNVKL